MYSLGGDRAQKNDPNKKNNNNNNKDMEKLTNSIKDSDVIGIF